MKYREFVVCRPVFIRESDVDSGVVQLVDYVAYAFSVLGLRQSTIAGHLSAVKFFHRVAGVTELDTQHPLVRCALRGVARGHADVGTQQRLRRPLAWATLQKGASLVPQWGSGGRVLFLALSASFFFLLRASEMFAVSKLAMHEVHGLCRGDVAFFRGEMQILAPGRWFLADRVELRFRSSKGDQFRKGAVCTRVRQRVGCSGETKGGAVAVMIELLSLYSWLPSRAPLVAFGVGGGQWAMWTKHQATVALRQVVALAGLPPEEYALHSLRIGGATHLAAGGASADVLRREGRWAGESSYQCYTRNVGADAEWVSEVLANASVEKQPGQGTRWGST